MVPIHSDSAVGLGRVANSRLSSQGRSVLGVRQKAQGRNGPRCEKPNKLQRLGEAGRNQLAIYHPEYIDQGTVF